MTPSTRRPRFSSATPRLPVLDLRRTIDFYTDVLGFRLDVLWPKAEPSFCILRRDGVSLAFDRAAENEMRHSGARGGFYVETDDVRGMHEALRDGVRIEWGPEVYHYGRREFAILDPDGAMIIFTEPTDDPPTCPED